MRDTRLIIESAAVDELLAPHAAALGNDFAAYRNHACRVANLCAAQLAAPAPEQLRKIAIAAAFHDLGIWTDKTLDYLAPSVGLATAYLRASGHAAWTAEISLMITEHHKISRFRGHAAWLVESFRRADLIDVSRGLFSFGLSRGLLRAVFSTWPNAGLHKRLVQLELGRIRTHPWNPLPMFKL
jgi:hypothetical protein